MQLLFEVPLLLLIKLLLSCRWRILLSDVVGRYFGWTFLRQVQQQVHVHLPFFLVVYIEEDLVTAFSAAWMWALLLLVSLIHDWVWRAWTAARKVSLYTWALWSLKRMLVALLARSLNDTLICIPEVTRDVVTARLRTQKQRAEHYGIWRLLTICQARHGFALSMLI